MPRGSAPASHTRCAISRASAGARRRACGGSRRSPASSPPPRRWAYPGKLERGLRQLARETDAQLLPDGGHVERSPRAQLGALEALIAARAALVARQAEVPPALQSAIDRAAPMLRFFRHGDGALALFNGADEETAETVERVLAHAEARGRAPHSAPHVGFQRLQAGRSLVIVDTGAPPRAGAR